MLTDTWDLVDPEEKEKQKSNKEKIKARIENQLRIHWDWLKYQEADFVARFLNMIVTQALENKKPAETVEEWKELVL